MRSRGAQDIRDEERTYLKFLEDVLEVETWRKAKKGQLDRDASSERTERRERRGIPARTRDIESEKVFTPD